MYCSVGLDTNIFFFANFGFIPFLLCNSHHTTKQFKVLRSWSQTMMYSVNETVVYTHLSLHLRPKVLHEKLLFYFWREGWEYRPQTQSTLWDLNWDSSELKYIPTTATETVAETVGLIFDIMLIFRDIMTDSTYVNIILRIWLWSLTSE